MDFQSLYENTVKDEGQVQRKETLQVKETATYKRKRTVTQANLNVKPSEIPALQCDVEGGLEADEGQKTEEALNRTELNTTKTTIASSKKRKLFNLHDLTYMETLPDILENNEDKAEIAVLGEQKRKKIGANSKHNHKQTTNHQHQKRNHKKRHVRKKHSAHFEEHKADINILAANATHKRNHEIEGTPCRRMKHARKRPQMVMDDGFFDRVKKHYETILNDSKNKMKCKLIGHHKHKQRTAQFRSFAPLQTNMKEKQKNKHSDAYSEELPLNELSDRDSLTSVQSALKHKIKATSNAVLSTGQKTNPKSPTLHEENICEISCELGLKEISSLVEDVGVSLEVPRFSVSCEESAIENTTPGSSKQFIWNWIQCTDNLEEVGRVLRKCCCTIKTLVRDALEQIKGPIPADVVAEYQLLEHIDSFSASLDF